MKAKKLKKELRSMVELKEFLKKPSPKVKVPLYTEIEVIQTTTNFGDDTVKKSRLDRIEERIDRIQESIANLAKIVSDGFKRINTRIDNLETRIDQIEARLDYYGLQIEGIQKRLDYNGLKKLPNSQQ